MGAMGVEATAAVEAYRLLKRDFPKYRGVVSTLYGFSLLAPSAAHRARAAYFPLRVMDDIADGDRITTAPMEELLRFREHTSSGNFNMSSRVDRLASKSLVLLDRVKRSGDDPRGDYVSAIDGIIGDRERVQNRYVMSAQELYEHNERSFAPALNILLIGMKSNLRVHDFPPGFPASFRTGYSLRDLKEDWHKGEINVPAEILEEAGLGADSSYSELITNQTVGDWIREDSAGARAHLHHGQSHPQLANERITRLAIKGFSKSAIGYIDAFNSSINVH